MVHLSLLVTIGIVLHIIENMFPVPFPVPGAKLGLANIVSLLVVALYGVKEGLIVNTLRCVIGAVLAGSFSSLIYSLSGAIMSMIIMALAYRYFKNTFSMIGISILGSVTHNFIQVSIASFLFSTIGFYIYLPYLMVIGLFTGFFNGLVANFIKRHISTTLLNINFVGEENIKNETELSKF